jgi:hypothetical protein
VPDPRALTPELEAALTFAQGQVGRLMRRLPEDPMAANSYPTLTKNGIYELRGSDGWDAGFLPLTLWLLYDLTGEAVWRKSAETSTLGLWDQAVRTGDHDLGFKLAAFAEAWRLTGDPVYLSFLLRGAATYVQTFDADGACVGAARSELRNRALERAQKRYQTILYPVLITSALSTPSLFTAAAQREGQRAWRDKGLRHLERLARDFVRPDGSTYDLVDYKPACPATGYRMRGTYKTLDDQGTWARGQGFALQGFALAHRDTGAPEMLAAARRVADFFLQSPTRPADGIPYWDLRFGPNDPKQSRDTSAAAIAAVGLLVLADLEDLDPAIRRRYREGGARLLETLATHYLARQQPEGVLAEATSDGPSGSNGLSIIVGDYYFLDGIRRLLGPNRRPARAPSAVPIEHMTPGRPRGTQGTAVKRKDSPGARSLRRGDHHVVEVRGGGVPVIVAAQRRGFRLCR